MDLYLTAMSLSDTLYGALMVLVVMVALGMVIFVHELGHFLVAKLCGVRVDKFYLGFDIFGWRLGRFRLGETEYGIGLLPLGGYVKMLGQEDNPARLREEVERARRELAARPRSAPGDQPGPGDQPTAEQPTAEQAAVDRDVAEQEPADEISDIQGLKEAEAALYDPRSYLAQSVPRRMAIISAGVVMNLLFAVFCATLAYRIGVREAPAAVGQVMPGLGAWQVGLKPDDRIVEVAGKPMHTFIDMREAVPLSDESEQGLPIVIRRPGVPEPLRFHIRPDRSHIVPIIGVSPSLTTILALDDVAIVPGSTASRATPPLEPGDRIVAMDEQPVSRYGELHAYLAQHPDKELTLTVERRVAPAEDGSAEENNQKPQTQRLVVRVPPQPMRRLGLVMKLGPVVAVQRGSPAEAAGIEPGDVLLEIDGAEVGDPMTLPERLRGRAGQTVVCRIERPGKPPRNLERRPTLRPVRSFAAPEYKGSPLDVPALGVACEVIAEVQEMLPDSPAAKAGMKPGDVVTRAVLVPPEDPPTADSAGNRASSHWQEVTVDFAPDEPNWPALIYSLQDTLPGTTVELSWKRGEEKKYTATLKPYTDPQWSDIDRGLQFESVWFTHVADGWVEAVQLGSGRTVEATLLVYRVIQRLGQRKLSPRMLVGPIGIFVIAKGMAEEGLPALLMFLTLISANLAVLNFLPIPVLDGGHMVFLIYEGIRGKPADERVQVGLAYLGLALLLGLMAWVVALDVSRLLG